MDPLPTITILPPTAKPSAFVSLLKYLGDKLALGLIMAIALLGYQHFFGAKHVPAPAVDAVATELGQKYRTAYEAIGAAQLDAVVASTAGSSADLATAQRNALDAALKASWEPVAAELTKRFGATSSTPGQADAVRAFYRDLAAGYRKGGK